MPWSKLMKHVKIILKRAETQWGIFDLYHNTKIDGVVLAVIVPSIFY
jgi:hypothetical protein